MPTDLLPAIGLLFPNISLPTCRLVLGLLFKYFCICSSTCYLALPTDLLIGTGLRFPNFPFPTCSLILGLLFEHTHVDSPTCCLTFSGLPPRKFTVSALGAHFGFVHSTDTFATFYVA
ncbi:unnamed protein product, partial [Pylaiella littoralis]